MNEELLMIPAATKKFMLDPLARGIAMLSNETPNLPRIRYQAMISIYPPTRFIQMVQKDPMDLDNDKLNV